ncbi:MAG: YceI family protein [Polyangiales bacterium]
MSSFSASTKRVAAVTAALSIVGVSSLAWAGYQKTGTASIAFHAGTNAEVTIDGTSNDLSVADDGTTVTFTAPVASLKTGIDLRDTHLRKYLEAEKYPTVTLSIVKGELKYPDDGKSLSSDIGSSVTLHGTKKYEKVSYSLARSGDTYTVTVKGLTLKLQDYGIAQPSFSGVKVNQGITVDVTASVKDVK